tara:strand:+ start:85 stop:360 length:276 start_codon:yes stop_codon:yes gene_type:complete
MVIYLLLSLLLAASAYIIFNLLKKVEQLEEANDELAEWVEGYEINLNRILTEITDIDSKHLFEDDDEVGQTFNLIRDAIKSLEDLKIKNEA